MLRDLDLPSQEAIILFSKTFLQEMEKIIKCKSLGRDLACPNQRYELKRHKRESLFGASEDPRRDKKRLDPHTIHVVRPHAWSCWLQHLFRWRKAAIRKGFYPTSANLSLIQPAPRFKQEPTYEFPRHIRRQLLGCFFIAAAQRASCFTHK